MPITAKAIERKASGTEKAYSCTTSRVTPSTSNDTHSGKALMPKALSQRADDEGPERGGHVLPEPAHVAHVVRVHGVDEGAGPQEQQGLEEGVGEEVEHACRPGADPESHHHVAQLADRGIGEDALHVVL